MKRQVFRRFLEAVSDGADVTFIYRMAQKSKPPPIFQKIVLKMRLDFFVKLKYESSTIIQSVGNKYSVRDLLL